MFAEQIEQIAHVHTDFFRQRDMQVDGLVFGQLCHNCNCGDTFPSSLIATRWVLFWWKMLFLGLTIHFTHNLPSSVTKFETQRTFLRYIVLKMKNVI